MGEAGALVAVVRDAPVHVAHQPVDQRQPQPLSVLLAAHERFEDMVAQFAPSRTTQEWIDLMEEADIPVMPVRMLHDLPKDPHLAATGFFQRVAHPTEGSLWTTKPPVRFSATPARHDLRPAPRLGEQTEEILNRMVEDL